MRDAAGGKGDWFGLRQEMLVEGGGEGEQRRHQGMDVTCGRWLGQQVENDFCMRQRGEWIGLRVCDKRYWWEVVVCHGGNKGWR